MEKEINKRNIAYVHYWHNLNIGDELLVIAFIKNTNFDEYIFLQRNWLNDIISRKSFNVVKGWFENTNKKILVESYSDFRNKDSFGDDLYSFNWIGGSVWSENALIEKSETFKELTNKGIKCNAWGGNLSYYKKPEVAKKYILNSLKSLSNYTFRDSYSSNFVDNGKSFFHDPVYSIGKDIRDATSQVEDRSFKIMISSCTPDKAFNSKFNFKIARKQILEKTINLIKENKGKDIVINLVNFEDKKDNINNNIIVKDICMHKEIGKFKIKIIEYDGNLINSLNIIRNSDYCINTRFHSIVLSNIFEKPSFNLIYDSKNKFHLNDIKFNTQNVVDSLPVLEKSSEEQFKYSKKIEVN